MRRWLRRLRILLTDGGPGIVELVSSGLKVATGVLRLQSCLAERDIVRPHDLTELICPAETAALELLVIRDLRALEHDFTTVFNSGDAELYRDQVLAISNYERLLKANVSVSSVGARKTVASFSKAEVESIHCALEGILRSNDRSIKEFITARIGVCYRLVKLQQRLAERYAIIPVGALYPGVVSINAEFDNLIRVLCKSPQDMYLLEARQFEELVAELWARMGYEVELTPETRDGGRDIVAWKSNEIKTQVLIECKRYAPGRPVGISVAQRMLGAIAQYDASQGVIATTSTFTRDAIKVIEAKQNRLTGHKFSDLVDLLWRVQMVLVPRIAPVAFHGMS